MIWKGEPFMRSFDIIPKRSGYNLDYNPNFSSPYHFFISSYRLFSKFGRQSTLRLKDHFNSPHLFHRDPEMVDMIARTWTRQTIQSFDSHITKELTNHLFETPQSNFGLDLMSLNIQRGRDHAIAPYNEMRVVCGLPRARQFSDLLDQIPRLTVERLSQIYRHVDDIDFFVGGISERPVSGGLLGWTFLCVVGDHLQGTTSRNP
ncbi:Chorion peroxidase [Armadillidium nasatum]|uniref:Chorion peroxidase n=1 Tax=Armadillidium nasatum TaxID=96803 RepID=A0A5N5TPT7_9CRUS|nr:Chorion peroxidase [Armadillidium nasatum]